MSNHIQAFAGEFKKGDVIRVLDYARTDKMN
jgi:hypothetical protein